MEPPRTLVDLILSNPKCGKTLRQIATFLDVNYETTWALINNRQRNMHLRTLHKIAKALGVTPQVVINGLREGYRQGQITKPFQEDETGQAVRPASDTPASDASERPSPPEV